MQLKTSHNKKIVVLVHGWMCSADNYKWNVNDIEKLAEIYTINLPGHLGATTHSDIYSIKQYADYLADFLNKLDSSSSIYLIGHSMGATIAHEYWKKNPQKVNKLILIGPPIDDVYFPLKNIIRKLLDRESNRRFALWVLSKLRLSRFFQWFWTRWLIGDNVEYFEQCQVTIDGMEGCDIKVIADGLYEQLSGLFKITDHVPDKKAVVIMGQNDPVCSNILAQKIFGLDQTIIIKDAKHTPNRTKSIEFNRIVTNLIR